MRGRRHAPTEPMRRQAEAMAAYGVPHEDIARVLGISPVTLRTHYRDALDTGAAKANARVAENLFRIATGSGREAVTAAIFWLKVRAGWSEFAPPRRDEAPGKKEAAKRAAEGAAEGTGWADLVH